MKKICIVLNHIAISNGVSQTAIGIANAIVEEREDVEVTLLSLFTVDEKMLEKINPKVKVKRVFNGYFRGFSKIVDFIPDRWLYKWIMKKEKYDVEIGFCIKLPIKIVAASTNKKAKKFAWVHTYKEFTKYYKKVDKVISVARGNVEKLLKDVEGATEVDFCLNPIDDRMILEQGAKDEAPQKPDMPLIVSVGRHSPEKGYDRLLNCVKRLKEEGFRFKVWLIGDGPIHEELKTMATELNVNDYVEFFGRQFNPHAYTKKADFFVCSSRREGYSTVCTESVILGVPVLTTAVSGGKEIIDESEAGLLVDNSGEALYKGMKWVLERPEVIAEWRKTLETTKERFSYETRKKKLFEVLEI